MLAPLELARTHRDAGTLQQAYLSGGYQVAPLLRSILLHPALYQGPRMVKPPVVYTAGLLRAVGRLVDAGVSAAELAREPVKLAVVRLIAFVSWSRPTISR